MTSVFRSNTKRKVFRQTPNVKYFTNHKEKKITNHKRHDRTFSCGVGSNFIQIIDGAMGQVWQNRWSCQLLLLISQKCGSNWKNMIGFNHLCPELILCTTQQEIPRHLMQISRSIWGSGCNCQNAHFPLIEDKYCQCNTRMSPTVIVFTFLTSKGKQMEN